MTNGLNDLPQVQARSIAGAEAFQREILAVEKPVILKGLVEHWPALTAGRSSPAAMNAYLKSMDKGLATTVMEAPASSGGRFVYTPDLQGFNFTKRQKGIAETLGQIEASIGRPDAPYLAIQMLTLDSHMPDFVRANPSPLLPPQIPPRLWVGGAVRTQTHNDRDHNLAIVLAGQRRFILFPPEQVANLYVGPLENPPPLSLVDPEAPDYARFPKFREAMTQACVACLDPGDALFLPKYWWHHVTSLAPYNVMVNYWWGDFATGLERASDCFLTALLALKFLPPGERRYWQAMFETHVFPADGDAVSHIPPALQGVLGPIGPGLRTKLRQELKMAYLKGGA